LLESGRGQDSRGAPVFTVVSLLSGPLIGIGFDEQATGDAGARIVAFFGRHLRPPAR